MRAPRYFRPGLRAIRDFIEAGGKVVSLPGPTAIMTALVASAALRQVLLPGFFAKGAGKRREVLKGLEHQQGTIILYAPPHGLGGLLEDLRRVLGNRRGL